MQCLLLQLKSRSVREASWLANVIGNWLTVSHTCLLYLPRKEVFLFWVGKSEVLSFFLVLIRWNDQGRWDQELLLLPQRFESLSSDLMRVRWRSLARVCVQCLLMVKLTVVGFCSIGGWCYSGFWVWGLRTLAQFQGSEMFPGLFQDLKDWYIKSEGSFH